MAASFGCSPICDSRSIEEHPLATLRTISEAPARMMRLLDLDMKFTRLSERLGECSRGRAPGWKSPGGGAECRRLIRMWEGGGLHGGGGTRRRNRDRDLATADHRSG